MFSNFRFKLAETVLITSAILLLAGCGVQVGEKPPPTSAYGFAGAECLSSTTPIIKNYLKGTANDVEVRALWDCFDSVVVQFKKNVRGSSSNSYSSQELATFLEQNFFEKNKKIKIGVALQLEIMKLKQLLLGGGRDFITRKELDDAVAVFENLRDVTVAINPYMKIITMNWEVDPNLKVQANIEFFEKSNLTVQKAATTLAGLFEKNGKSYALTDFLSFMQELALFYGEDWDCNKSIKEYLPVAQKVKKALAGGNQDVISANEWPRFTLLGARGYIQYLRYYYFIKSANESGLSYRLAYISRTVEDLLSVFEDLTAQKPEGVVSRDEVFDTLLTLSKIWSEFKVSSGLIDEMMKVKQLFFGGSADSFTATDFNTARIKINKLKSLTERFMPFWSIYSMNWDKGLYSPEEALRMFLESQSTLQITGKELGELFEKSYDVRDLIALAKEFERLYQINLDPAPSKILERNMALILDSKMVLFGGASPLIDKNHWAKLLNFGARFYSDYLYFHYFLKDADLNQVEAAESQAFFVNQSLDIFVDLLRLKEGKALTQSELSIIGYDLIQAGYLPKGIDQVSVNKVIKLILNNVLVDTKMRIGKVIPNALNLDSLQIIREEFRIWVETQKFILNISDKWGASEGLSGKDLLAKIKYQRKSIEDQPVLEAGLKELVLTLDSAVPITIDDLGRLIISNRFQQVYTRNSLKQLNISRGLSRLMIRSFALDLGRIESYQGLSFQEVQDVFLEVKNVFVQLGLLEEKDIHFAESRFRDANLFTPHGDGNKLASFQEVTDLVGMILSGLKVNSEVKKDLLIDCLNGRKTPTDNTEVKLDCALSSYRKSLPQHMLATPEFLKYAKSAEKNGDFGLYILNVFKAAGYLPNEKKLVKWGDLSLVPHAVQYIEMLIARYDKNKDGAITTAEAIRAYSLFKELLLDYAKDDIKDGTLKEQDLFSIFCFMLNYGKPPETYKEKLLYFVKWKGKKPEDLDVWADRGNLAQVLGYVAEKTAKVKSQEIPNIDQIL